MVPSKSYPLTAAQKRLWFDWKRNPNSAQHNLSYHFRIQGPLDLPAFVRAWSESLGRHEALRTQFELEHGKPFQALTNIPSFEPDYIDLSLVTISQKEQYKNERFVEARGLPFDLAKPPLFRACLVKKGEAEFDFNVVFHHIVIDGYSLQLLLREVSKLYEAYNGNRSFFALPQTVSIADYLHDEAAMLTDEYMKAAKQFWQAYLTNAVPLDWERKRSTNRNADPSKRVYFELPEELTAVLWKLSRACRQTLNTTLHAAFHILLHRFSRQQDVLTAYPINQRSLKFRNLFGFFINNLPLYTHFDNDPTYLDVVRQIAEHRTAVKKYESLPTYNLIAAQREQRAGLAEHLLDVVFSSVNFTANDLQLSGCQVVSLPVDTNTTPGDFVLMHDEQSRPLRFALDYNVGRFDEFLIRQFIQSYQILLEGICHAPEQKVSAYNLLDSETKKKIFSTWNRSEEKCSGNNCIHQLIERQVEQTPGATAIVCGNRQLTYYELNARANRLARYLQKRGINPESPIGICLERSSEQIISVLAILKVGGAYVPLEPTYPASRLKFMLDDTQTRFVITHSSLQARMTKYDGEFIFLDLKDRAIERESSENLRAEISPKQLAYIIYTSGSTGAPKGVMVEHRGVCNLAVSQAQFFGIDRNSGVLQFASLSFDASVSEWATTLTAGATLYILEANGSSISEALIDILKNHRITVTTFPPTLVSSLPASALAGLKTLVVAGEACTESIRKNWFEKLRLINAYGPTEATVCASMFVCTNQHPAATIGKALDHVELYVLDQYLQPVPIGVVGELHIGGVGLARGYLNQSKLTQEKFIHHPFRDDPDARLYKAGDLVRYLPDGNLEYLGRMDDQIKIRGYRIEPNEIEAVLREDGRIDQAVVIAREDIAGHSRLVAYVVANLGALQTASLQEVSISLRELAASKLPEYMVPSAFVIVEKIPLTSAGKIDRAVLAQLSEKPIKPALDTHTPRTAAEQKLARIWQEVLHLETVGVRDNFFELGGDSIICIQMVAKAAQEGIQLDINEVFASPTIMQLAAHVKEASAPTQVGHASLTTFSGEEIPLTPIQRWFFAQEFPNYNHYNQAVLLTPAARLDSEILEKSLWLLLQHHFVFHLRFDQREGKWIQKCVEVAALSIKDTAVCRVIELGEGDEEQWAGEIKRIADEAQAGVNIETGPIWQMVLFNCGRSRSQRLLLVIHHLLVDTVSWGILLNDLKTAYHRLSQGLPAELPPVTNSFQKWAVALQAIAASGKSKGNLDYWLNTLSASSVTVPLDFQKGDNIVAWADTIYVSLNREETHQLLQVAPQAYRTRINDLLLAALLLSIGDALDEYRLRFDLESHGREAIAEGMNLSRTVGWLTSLFPVHLCLENPRDLAAVILSVKEQLRRIPHNGIEYGILKYLCEEYDEVQKLRDAAASHLVFNYMGQQDRILDDDGFFQYAAADTGANINHRNPRQHAWEINCQVKGGRFQIAWTFSLHQYHAATIQKFAQRFIQRLQALIVHCCDKANFGYSPSDFPLARLTQDQIDNTLNKISGVEEAYPLSPMQLGLLFHGLYQPDSEVYFMQSIFELAGHIDETVIQAAWQQLVATREVLRTAFLWEGVNEPLQFVRRSVNLPWQVHDWQSYSELEIESRLERLIRDDRQQGFDLSQPPLMRLNLIRLQPNRCYLLWSHHHLILDGWCGPLLIRDFQEIYQQILSRTPPTPVYRRPYRDYIAFLQQQDQPSAERFWRNHLAKLEKSARLKIKIPAPQETEPSDYLTHCFALDETTTTRLRQFAQQQGLTLNTIIQGAWSLLLQRYTQQETVMFGVTISGRAIELAGIEELVGICINTLPLCVDCSPEQQMIDFLKTLQAQTMQMQKYAYVSLAKIQHWSNCGAGDSLFDNILIFENYPITETSADAGFDLGIRHVRSFERTEYPLVLMIMPGAALRFEFTSQVSHFSHAALRQLGEHLQNLLEQMMAIPRAKLSDVEMLSPAERQKILTTWNSTQSPYQRDICMPQLFEAQVSRSPAAPAIRFGAIVLSYQTLNFKANQLAHYLKSMGVKSEIPVAIALDRSADMMVSLLGVWKAGGAYVPLDLCHPDNRLKFVLADAQAPVLITQAEVKHRFADYRGHLISLDECGPEIMQQERSNPVPAATSDHLAYIIYTSGSTGKPKGVEINHRNLANLMSALRERFAVSHDDVWLAVTTIAFDISVLEIFLPLINGAQVVMAPQAVLTAGERLAGLIEQENVTIMQATPVTWKMLLDSGWKARPDFKILCGGEVLAPELAKALCHLNARLWNLYGPTETTVWSLMAEITSEHAIIPIGRPITNTEVYILDHQQRPVPIGVIGELFIGGDGVARGYHHRADLTRKRFFPNHFKDGSEERMYKTGDLARYLPDGAIEFIGRSDHQIKLRGHRIEAGEIETVLQQHPQVKEAIVMLREEPQPRLVAYLIIANDSGTAQSNAELIVELRQYLAHELPEYMIPRAFVLLDRFPLTANGKIDRQSLPASAISLRSDDMNFVLPRNWTERQLAEIWEMLFEVERVSVRDNFFVLGGDSITCVQMVARARQKEIFFEVKQVFASPTIAELAAIADGNRTKESHQILSPSTKEKPEFRKAFSEDKSLEAVYPLSPAQSGMLFQSLYQQDSPVYIAQSMLELSGVLDLECLQNAWLAAVKQHEVLRTGFVWENLDRPLQYVKNQVALPWSCEDWTGSDDEVLLRSLQDHLLAERQKKFDLTQAPLFRLKLIKVGGERHFVLWSYHHIILDGWSRTRLLNDLVTTYETLRQGQPIHFPVARRYHEYIDWLYQQDNEPAEQFWRKNLAGFRETVSLNMGGHGKTESADSDFASFKFILDLDVSQQLKEFAQHHGFTMSTVLYSAWAILLNQYSRKDDIVFGVTVSGRALNFAGIQDMVGLFINTLPLRVTIPEDGDLLHLLAQVQTRIIALQEFSHAPLVKIKAWSEVPPANALFDHIVVMENFPATLPAKKGGLEIKPVAGYAQSEYPLGLTVIPEKSFIFHFDYQQTRFDRKGIEQLAKHFEAILQYMINKTE